MIIETVSIASLVQDPANVRLHPEANLAAIKASLARFGQQKPIVVGKNGVVVAGNGTLAAATALGWKEINVVRTTLEGSEAVAYAIADNRTAELAEWDGEALGKVLESLEREGLLDSTGFSDEDLLGLLGESPDESVEDEGPEDPSEKPTSKRGDLWILGEHRLFCGDSSSAEDFARLMDGKKAALLSTDPPYCVNYTGNDRPVHDGRKSGKDWSDVYREIDIKDLGEFLQGVMVAVLPHVVENAAVYMWHAHLQQPTIAAVFERHDILLHQILVWVKPVATFGHSYYRWKHEPCAFGWRRGHKPEHGFGQLDSVWEVDWEGKARITTFHPTSKPTKLFEIPIEVHTKPGDVVVEPFGGSGSQIIAAERFGRRCFAMEISPAFVDGIVRRWEKATGKDVRLDGSGETFAAVAEARAVSASGAPCSASEAAG